MAKKNFGFTLIELLVVIAIFALIANVTMVSLNKAKREARDAERMSDINQLRSALHLFYTEKLFFPAGAGEALGASGNNILDANGWSDGSAPAAPVYMTQVPRDPRMVSAVSPVACSETSSASCDYGYTNTGDGDFVIYFFLEGKVGDKEGGLYRATRDLIEKL